MQRSLLNGATKRKMDEAYGAVKKKPVAQVYMAIIMYRSGT
jgi:hypothetical protein